MNSFDPKFEFLLDWTFENLFEDITNILSRCKGCSEEVSRWNRKEHHKNHLKERRMIHQAAIVTSTMNKIDPNAGAPKVIVCRTCNTQFEIERKRGRPPINCPKCRGMEE